MLSLFGQGALVCGTDRLSREVLGHPDSRAIYAVADVEGPLFDGVALPVSIAFFLSRDNRGSQLGSPLRLSARAGELSDLVDTIQGARERACSYPVNGRHPAATDLTEPFEAAGKEHASRLKDAAAVRPHHDVSLKNGRIHLSLSVFAQMGLAKKHRLTEIRALHRHNPSYFGQNGRAWRELVGYAEDGLLTLSEPLQNAAVAAIEEAETISTPLFPVPAIMRLGWLSDLDSIRCIEDDFEKGFVSGKDEDLPEAYLDPRAYLSERLYSYKRQKRLNAGEDPSTVNHAALKHALRNSDEPSRATTRHACPSCRADTTKGWSGTACRRCGHVHKRLRAKPAYAHLASAFKSAVKFIDELSEIRGDESLRSKALRAISRGPHVYGGTGTPL